MDVLSGMRRNFDSNRQLKVDLLHKPNDSLPILSGVDKKILKSLLSSTGAVSSLILSRELEIPLSTVQRRRKRLESIFVEILYSVKAEKFGWHNATLYISTEKGMTSSVAITLLSWQEIITSVSRTMGEANFDIKAEIVFKDNVELLDIMAKVKTIRGIKDVSWTEIVQVLGKNKKCFDDIIGKA